MLKQLDQGSLTANQARKMAYIADLKTRAVAEVPAKANEQHYEVPAELYGCIMVSASEGPGSGEALRACMRCTWQVRTQWAAG